MNKLELEFNLEELIFATSKPKEVLHTYGLGFLDNPNFKVASCTGFREDLANSRVFLYWNIGKTKESRLNWDYIFTAFMNAKLKRQEANYRPKGILYQHVNFPVQSYRVFPRAQWEITDSLSQRGKCKKTGTDEFVYTLPDGEEIKASHHLEIREGDGKDLHFAKISLNEDYWNMLPLFKELLELRYRNSRS